MGRLLGHSPITNITELFAALAVGWDDKTTPKRFIIAGEGGQFVRTPESGWPHCFYKMQSQDIRIDSGGYVIRGFVLYETRILYPGMFDTRLEDVYVTAHLTLKGFEFARSGINDVVGVHPDVDRCAFFNPAAQVITKDPALAGARPAVGSAA